MKKFTLKHKISNLSQEPGVYFFMDKNEKIIYIGKATNLKNRVQSYFRNVILSEAKNLGILHHVQDDTRTRPIEMMIHKVSDIKIQKTDSVLEALILESNLIKKYQPKYNVDLRDDQSFSYFVITKEKFPRVLILRTTDIDFKNLKTISYKLKAVYGPYTSRKQILIALKIIRKIFPFHSNKQETEKGCLDYQIGLCPGPYDGAISKTDYLKNIRGIKMILGGRKKSLVKKLEKEMKEFAKKHEFEKAAEIRNKVFALNHINDIALMNKDFQTRQIPDTKYQILNTRIEAYDISNISGQHAVGSMVVFANDKPDKSQYRKFKIRTIEGSDDVGMMREVLLRRFKNDWPMPDLILLDGGIGHINMGAKLFKNLGLAVPIIGVAKGSSRKNTKYQIPDTKKFPNTKITKEAQEILFNRDLVKSIMDEAHRFAITFHRKIRRRNALR